MEARAILKNSPFPERKMRLLADVVRNKPVAEALNILSLHKKKLYASYLYRLIRSAVANWEGKYGEDAPVDIDDLYIKEIRVDKGRVLKRWQTAPRGMPRPIRKRFSHITVVVAPMTPVPVSEETENTETEE